MSAILSGALIALALVAQADHFGPVFISIAGEELRAGAKIVPPVSTSCATARSIVGWKTPRLSSPRPHVIQGLSCNVEPCGLPVLGQAHPLLHRPTLPGIVGCALTQADQLGDASRGKLDNQPPPADHREDPAINQKRGGAEAPG